MISPTPPSTSIRLKKRPSPTKSPTMRWRLRRAQGRRKPGTTHLEPVLVYLSAPVDEILSAAIWQPSLIRPVRWQKASKACARPDCNSRSQEGEAMLEIIIILCMVAGIVWIIRKVWAEDRALDDAALDQAWRIVLDDPNYVDRRRHEERKRIVDKAGAVAANR